MGNTFGIEKKPFQYGVFLDIPSKEGETKILRRPDVANSSLYKSDQYGLGSVIAAFDRCLLKFPNKKFLGTRKHIQKDEYGEYEWKTFAQINELSNYFLYGINELNLCPEINFEDIKETYKFFGIYSKNREEWVVADLGCQKNSITIVTIYDTLGVQAIEFIFNQTLLTSILMESKTLNKIISLKKENKVGHLQNIIVLPCENDDEMEANFKLCKELGFNMYYYDEIIQRGKEFDKNNKTKPQFKKATPETILVFCYTSGTTGNPKGAMIPNNCLLSAVTALQSIGETLTEDDVYFSYLPLAHIMEQLIMTATMVFGCSVGFFSGSPLRLAEDCQHLHPTYFCGVPRVFTKVYDLIMKNINQNKNKILKNIALKAIETKLNNYKNYGVLHHVIYDALVFNRIRNILGGKIRFMIVGSAPMPSEVIKFLRIAFCCPIIEGYGQTENCAGVLLSHRTDTSSGHLGGLSGCCELKLVDVPELGYTSKDVNEQGIVEPRGEICIRGSNVFKGYFRDVEKTREALDEDGWLHSGDIGVIMTSFGNAVRIIDRKKNIFKISQGEYIATDKVENCLSNSKYVNQICIYGDSLKSYIISIVVPEKEECLSFLREKGIEVNNDNIEEYYDKEILKKEILKDLDNIGRKNDLKGFEIPKAVYLSKESFSAENNLSTPTMKLKHAEIRKKFAKEIEEMYKAE